jgi:hypothetical protein
MGSDLPRGTASATMPYTPARPAPRRQNERRGGIAVVMIISLLASAFARYWADDLRETAIPHLGENASRTSLSSMNSFALGLLLGGLRGPLVMILWTQSESQKTEKNLEGVDTQIEWIRLLQPEFDTVHIFQIWNKAYNISVQMASLANKYDVILGAMDYAHNVDREKPDDINIVAAIGQLYFDKLGNSQEKLYYRKRVRAESQWHTSNQKARQQDPGWRRVQLDSVLDPAGYLLPNLYKPQPGRARPANLPANAEWDDGSDLQYLHNPRYEPFTDGVSPFAFAYNYYKRAEVLQNLEKQHHDQLSDMVVDSRPALSLKFWGEEEMEQAHLRELQAFDIPMRENLEDQQRQETLLWPTAGFKVGAPVKDPAALKLAIADYARTANVLRDSLGEYRRHIRNFPEKEQQSHSYMEEITLEIALAEGDLAYLKAFETDNPADRDTLLRDAAADYRNCRKLSYQMLLQYYVAGNFVAQAYPPGFGYSHTSAHKGIEDMTLEQSAQTLKDAEMYKRQSHNDYQDSDRYEFDRFIHRSLDREAAIADMLGRS